MNAELFKTLAATGGMYIPISPDAGGSQNLRRPEGSRPAEFPPYFYPPPK
jgi:N-acetylglucosamine-6-sulfatase